MFCLGCRDKRLINKVRSITDPDHEVDVEELTYEYKRKQAMSKNDHSEPQGKATLLDRTNLFEQMWELCE